jgi:hypothetical protein
MLWAYLKVPHRGLPRASARREAAYPSQTPEASNQLRTETEPPGA